MIQQRNEIKLVGHGDMMELLIKDSSNIHVNSSGRGTIYLTSNEPCILYFQKDSIEKGFNNNILQPLINFQVIDQISVKKVRDRIYDFTIPNEKIIELHFDENMQDLRDFDETLVNLGMQNNAIFYSSDKNNNSSLADMIEKGGDLICKGIESGSYWIGVSIKKGGESLKQNTKPNETPTEIHPAWEKGLSSASNLSSSVKSATKVFSNTIVNTFCFIIDKSIGKSLKTKNPTIQSTARASLKIIDSLVDAGEHLLQVSTDTTSDYIEYKYGADAAIAARHSGRIAKNSYRATDNMRKVGTKSLIKAVGKVAAKRNSQVSVSSSNSNGGELRKSSGSIKSEGRDDVIVNGYVVEEKKE